MQIKFNSFIHDELSAVDEIDEDIEGNECVFDIIIGMMNNNQESL